MVPSFGICVFCWNLYSRYFIPDPCQAKRSWSYTDRLFCAVYFDHLLSGKILISLYLWGYKIFRLHLKCKILIWFDFYICIWVAGRASPKCYECPKKYTGPTIWFHWIKLKLFKIQLTGSSLALFWFRKTVISERIIKPINKN